MTQDIGDVLALKSDKVDQKVPFDTFRGKLSDYIVKEFSNEKDSVDIAKMMTDPELKFDQKNNPQETTEEDLKFLMNSSIQYKFVKLYVSR